MRQIWILGMMLLCSSIILGQGWEHAYRSNTVGSDAIQTSNGGFIAVGYTFLNYDLYVVRTDENGSVLWEETYGEDWCSELFAASIRQTDDGGFIVGGNTDCESIFLVKIDGNGTVLWEQIINIDDHTVLRSLEITADGGFIIAGTTHSNALSRRGFLMKTNENGIVEWQQTYENGTYNIFESVKQTIDGGFITTGGTTIKTDGFGNIEWERDDLRGNSVDLVNDDGYIILYGFNMGEGLMSRLTKIDSNGDTEWEQESDSFQGRMVTCINNNAFIESGETFVPGTGWFTELRKLDQEGNIIWTNTFLGSGTFGSGPSVHQTNQGGYILCNTFNNQLNLINTDSLGNSISNQITGNVAFDQSEDCIIDSLEFSLQNWMVAAQSETQTYYGTTDSVGNYNIKVDSGSYITSIIPPSHYWEACGNDTAITFDNFYDTSFVDFPVQAVTDCALLSIDISTSFLRRCFDSEFNNYYVQYCNEGTLPSDQNGYITITFDDYLIVNNSTLDWSEQDGNTYTFDIESLEIGECGSFSVNVGVSCLAEVGQTHCVEAHIFPDSLCSPLDSLWDGANIEVTADIIADGDSIQFLIQNIGEGMTNSSDFIITEDHLILRTEPFQLQSDQSILETVPCNGSTYRLETMQTEGHPIGNRPSVAVEGCGTNDEGGFSMGFVIQFPEDDLSPFVSIDCQENVGAYDPNDKMGYPKGYAEQHFIEPNTDIEYKIRFQNTGTAPAFQVVIIDTLSHLLDPTSIIPGASSHPYQFELYGSGIVKFTFDDINLPDSTSNEPASHGFVKFRISQKENIPLRSIIENEAAIYFDYNAPIITNTTFHQIGENFVHVLVISDTDFSETENTFLKVFPNPFTESTTFSIEGAASFEKIQLNIYDVAGKLVEQKVYNTSTFQFDKNNLQNGLYFFELETENGVLSTGKMIVH